MRGAAAALIGLALAACTPAGEPSAPRGDAVRGGAPAGLSNVRFEPRIFPRGVRRANAALAEDFLDLAYGLEGGGQVPGLLRYRQPVRVAIRNRALGPYAPDLDYLVSRLRAEAGIDIRLVASAAGADILVDGATMSDLQRANPGAACIVAPGVGSWTEYRRRGTRGRIGWGGQRTLGRTTLILPLDAPPQTIRDCLHEELAQALGLANDLYRLPDSVFNDDNRHAILTPFDMLMLRVLYHRDLAAGLPRQAAAARVPAILDDINPEGRGIGTLGPRDARPGWDAAIAMALGQNNPRGRRLSAANRAVALARSMQPADHRLDVALITRGRLTRDADPQAAARDFREAYAHSARTLGERDLRTAQAALHVALDALDRGDPARALALADQSLPAASTAQDAILVAGLHAVRSRALSTLGRDAAAQEARLDHLRWARYAYGDGDGARGRTQAALERALTALPPDSRSPEP